MAINLEKGSVEKAYSETANNPTAEIEEVELTSESLKNSTKIHGWLSFFLFQSFIGGLFSAIYPIVTFDISEYGGSYILGMTDVFFGVLLFVLAIFTLCSFCYRKPNAVFYGTSYVVLCIISNLLILCSGSFGQTGYSSTTQIVRSLVWGCIWLIYLHQSNQVEEVIPSDFRILNKKDYLLVASAIVIPVLFMVIGVLDTIRIQNAENEKAVSQYNELHRNFYNDVKNTLPSNQRTDGRVIFEIPQGFECNDTTIQDSKVFNLSNNYTSLTLCSDFDTDSSDEHINTYWKNWEDAEISTYKSSIVAETKDFIGKCTKNVKVKKYTINGNVIYWRFVMLFDVDTEKICLISAYDQGDDAYLNALIESIRFHP